MRIRSTTIYAENFDDFLKVIYILKIVFTAIDDDEELGSDHEYVPIKPLKEQEKDEEDAIIKSHNSIPFIKNMKLLLIGDVKSENTSFINSFFNQQNN